MKPEGIPGMSGGMDRRPSNDFHELYVEKPDDVIERTPQDVLREITIFLTRERLNTEEYRKQAQSHLDTLGMVFDLLTDADEKATALEGMATLETILAKKD